MKPHNAKRRSRKILFVLNDPRYFVTHRLALAHGVRSGGYDVHVAVPEEGDTPSVIKDAGFPVHFIPLDRQGVSPAKDFRSLVSLIVLYHRLEPSLVHHVTVKPVLYGSIAARMSRVPAVVNAVAGLGTLFAGNGFSSAVRSAVTRAAYRRAVRHRNARTIFQNCEDRDAFVRAGIVAEGTSLIIPGSGVDLSAFYPERVPDGPPIVVLAARLLKQKGVREFVAAARQIKEESIPARFALVGDGAGNRDAISESDLRAWRDEGVVEMWGWQDDMPAVMARASIVCLPSYYREGLPKGLIDACAGGRPIVTTDTPGCRDVVTHGDNGLLIPPRDVPALTQALRELLTDRFRRMAMGTRAREVAEARFDIAHVVRATIATYEKLGVPA